MKHELCLVVMITWSVVDFTDWANGCVTDGYVWCRYTSNWHALGVERSSCSVSSRWSRELLQTLKCDSTKWL